jgi:hypothetical protein
MPKTVLVQWHDAIHLPLNWQSTDAYIKRADTIYNRNHYTCGFLVKETDDYVLICLDFTEAMNSTDIELINMAQIIHKNMIMSIKELDIKNESINSNL